MALSYAGGTYRDGDEALTEAELIARRDQQIDAWGDELAAISVEELGAGETVAAIEFPATRIEAFAARFLRRVGEIVTSAYVWAAGGVDRVSEAGWRTVAGLVDRQELYVGGFVNALKRGELSAAEAVARSRQYAGAAVTAFEHGRAALVGVDDLPAMPGEGCLGGVNCRCYWSYEDDGAHWIAVGDRNTCQVCAGRAANWAPYRAQEAA